MNAFVDWKDHVPEREGVKSTINEVAFSPDASKLVAAVGNRVLLYDAESGNLLESLRGHKDTVLTVDWNSDGTRFASGGADKVVVIWKSSGQGMLKYNHTSPVQRVRYNPTALQLVSCADDDFGLWTPEQKQVQKEKVNSKILSACWNIDGSLLAIGMQSGSVIVRTNHGAEVCRVDRTMPVWCLVFAMGIIPATPAAGKTPSSGSTQDAEVLMIGCWDKTVSCYKIAAPTSSSGNNAAIAGSAQKTSERNIKFYPTSISITGGINSKNSFLLITGANKKCILFSRDCMKLTEIANKSSWIWSCSTPHYGATSNKLAIACDNGDIDVLSLKFDNVYAINTERYAFRENLTEIVVQHLITDRKVRIKCRDLVQKLALYKNKLAVQVSDKVFIYESNAEDLTDIHFRLKKERVTHNIVSNQMAVSMSYLIFSNKNILTLYTFTGVKCRSWTFESAIRYFKMDTGLMDRECLICSLQNGAIYKIFIDNPFPLEICKREAQNNTNKGSSPTAAAASNGITCVDLNLHRSMIATIDQNRYLLVSDIQTQEVLFRYTGVTHVCFNSEVDDMLCFSTETAMYVVSGLNTVSTANAPAAATEAPAASGFGRNRGSAAAAASASSAAAESVNTPPIRSHRGDELIPQEQHIGGPATGLIFSGQRIFCLYRGLMTNLDIPQGNNIQNAVEQGDFENAYHLACLGATSADWKLLGMRALRANHLTIAKNCFARLQDTKYLSLIDTIEMNKSGGNAVIGDDSAGRSGFSGPKSPENRRNYNRNNANAFGKENFVAASGGGKGASVAQPPLEATWLAEMVAYEGHSTEAAKIYARANKISESIRLLTELRRWNDAKLFLQSALSSSTSGGLGASSSTGIIDLNELTLRQAKWLQEINDWKGAAELHVTLGQYMAACKIVVESNVGEKASAVSVETPANTPDREATAAAQAAQSNAKAWKAYLLDLMRRVPKEQADVLHYCGDTFVTVEEDDMARETYTKIGAISKLMFLFGRKQMWNEAAKLAEEHPGEFDCSVFLPYAEWLISQDKYMDAMHAYKKANRRDLARKVLEELTYNCVVESRFKDAGYYYWLLSREYESLYVELMNGGPNAGGQGGNKSRNNNQNNSKSITAHANAPPPPTVVAGMLTIEQCQQQQIECEHKADLYYAYSTIHSYIMDPFTTHLPDTLFQVCRFLVNSLGGNNGDQIVPYGISKASTYYTLAKQAMRLGCFKLARYAFDRLGKLQLSLKKHEDEIELDMLIVQAKPVHDNPDYAPACYRCGATNPLLNPFTNKFAKGDVCTSCGHPFVRSFINFDILPVVEFVPDPMISDEEAIELIRSPPPSTLGGGALGSSSDSKRPGGGGGAQAKDSWKESKDDKTNANILSLDDEIEDDADINESLMNTNMSTMDSRGGAGFGSAGGMFSDVDNGSSDLFTRCLNRTLERQNNGAYIPVTVDANALLTMKRGEVFVCKPSSKHKRATFYRNMLPDIAVAISQPCHRFFHLEDFEFSYLSEARCPYSRLVSVGEYGSL